MNTQFEYKGHKVEYQRSKITRERIGVGVDGQFKGYLPHRFSYEPSVTIERKIQQLIDAQEARENSKID